MVYADCRELELDVTLSSFSDESTCAVVTALGKLVDRLRSPVVIWSIQRQEIGAVVGDQRRGPPLQDRPDGSTGQQHVFRLDILDNDRRNAVVCSSSETAGTNSSARRPRRRAPARLSNQGPRGRQGRDLMYLICSVPNRGMRGLAPLRA